MSLRSAKIMGGIFFAGRLILAIITGLFPGLVCSSEDLQFCKILGLVIPIGFGIGALTDLILVIGAYKKSTGALYFWWNNLLGHDSTSCQKSHQRNKARGRWLQRSPKKCRATTTQKKTYVLILVFTLKYVTNFQ